MSMNFCQVTKYGGALTLNSTSYKSNLPFWIASSAPTISIFPISFITSSSFCRNRLLLHWFAFATQNSYWERDSYIPPNYMARQHSSKARIHSKTSLAGAQLSVVTTRSKACFSIIIEIVSRPRTWNGLIVNGCLEAMAIPLTKLDVLGVNLQVI